MIQFTNVSIDVLYTVTMYISVYIIIVAELHLIDLREKEINWEEKIKEICATEVELHLVKEWYISHPWLLICNAISRDMEIDVNEAISKGIPDTNEPGMKDL